MNIAVILSIIAVVLSLLAVCLLVAGFLILDQHVPGGISRRGPFRRVPRREAKHREQKWLREASMADRHLTDPEDVPATARVRKGKIR